MTKQATALLSEFDADPGRFVMCVPCGTIIRNAAPKACPQCQGYRFEADPLKVRTQILAIGAKGTRGVQASDML